jgi:hypothetical protein
LRSLLGGSFSGGNGGSFDSGGFGGGNGGSFDSGGFGGSGSGSLGSNDFRRKHLRGNSSEECCNWHIKTP